jgi:pilus assembly protein CpaB
MIAVAVGFGLLAVFVAQGWLTRQAEMRARSLEAQKTPVVTRTIVVASQPLRFGTTLGSSQLREMPWPQDALPTGAFGSISELLAEGKRVALTPIEPNEPILATKITGAGQRATLSAMLHQGMKAVTVRVNDVEGVAGFVLPGDRVDVVLTRQADKSSPTSDVVLQNARVLATDQLADERSDKPNVVKAVTLEVDIAAAQKVALASSIGTLSLILRKAGEAASEQTRRVTVLDLNTPSEAVAFAPPEPSRDGSLATVTVTRAGNKQEYSVPAEADAGRMATAGRGQAAD